MLPASGGQGVVVWCTPLAEGLRVGCVRYTSGGVWRDVGGGLCAECSPPVVSLGFVVYGTPPVVFWLFGVVVGLRMLVLFACGGFIYLVKDGGIKLCR